MSVVMGGFCWRVLLQHTQALERVRQEVVLYGLRLDVSEELSRLGVHLDELARIIDTGGGTKRGNQVCFDSGTLAAAKSHTIHTRATPTTRTYHVTLRANRIVRHVALTATVKATGIPTSQTRVTPLRIRIIPTRKPETVTG